MSVDTSDVGSRGLLDSWIIFLLWFVPSNTEQQNYETSGSETLEPIYCYSTRAAESQYPWISNFFWTRYRMQPPGKENVLLVMDNLSGHDIVTKCWVNKHYQQYCCMSSSTLPNELQWLWIVNSTLIYTDSVKQGSTVRVMDSWLIHTFTQSILIQQSQVAWG